MYGNEALSIFNSLKNNHGEMESQLLLGKILPDRFPFPLDRGAAKARSKLLIADVAAATAARRPPIPSSIPPP